MGCTRDRSATGSFKRVMMRVCKGDIMAASERSKAGVSKCVSGWAPCLVEGLACSY
jgi:hypothetical protein